MQAQFSSEKSYVEIDTYFVFSYIGVVPLMYILINLQYYKFLI